jgi:hypothetical protein
VEEYMKGHGNIIRWMVKENLLTQMGVVTKVNLKKTSVMVKGNIFGWMDIVI